MMRSNPLQILINLNMKKIKEVTAKIPNVYKTFLWNLLYQTVAFALKYAADNLAGLNIPAEYAAIVGLLLSGASKYLLTKK